MKTITTTETPALFAAGYRIEPFLAGGLFRIIRPTCGAYIVNANDNHCNCAARVECKHLKGFRALIAAQVASYEATARELGKKSGNMDFEANKRRMLQRLDDAAWELTANLPGSEFYLPDRFTGLVRLESEAAR